MVRSIRVATCALSQWALDFEGNLSRTLHSLRIAWQRGAAFRCGPELELCGYGCDDHFFEADTYDHCWESLSIILVASANEFPGLLFDIGMPVVHKGRRYSAKVVAHNGQIIFIRPKAVLSNTGGHAEGRWFCAFPWNAPLESFDEFPVSEVGPHSPVPFGVGVLRFMEAHIMLEISQEMSAPEFFHGPAAHHRSNIDLFANGAAFTHKLNGHADRLSLIRSRLAGSGGAYMMANQRGVDSGPLYYDGAALIVVSGDVVAEADQRNLSDVEVVVADIDLDAIQSRRVRPTVLEADSRDITIEVKSPHGASRTAPPTAPISPTLPPPEQQIAQAPAAWLFHYLRRSGARGFFLPLSGGADSGAVAAIVGSMCQIVMEHVNSGNEEVTAEVERVSGVGRHAEGFPKTHKELCSLVLHTAYLGNSAHSSDETKQRAAALSSDVGSRHVDVDIAPIVRAYVDTAEACLNTRPSFAAHGGSEATDLALQNIQARARLSLSYFLGSLMPEVRGLGGGPGYLLVLATGNADEALAGYYTKYDCASGDICPIGTLCKEQLREFLKWAAPNLGYPSLLKIVEASPSAELRPSVPGAAPQTDEADIGLTYSEMRALGEQRAKRNGPFSLFQAMRGVWQRRQSSTGDGSEAAAGVDTATVARKVGRFLSRHFRNRHKASSLAMSLHTGDHFQDALHDRRPVLYPELTRQMRSIAAVVEEQEEQDRRVALAEKPVNRI
eukprot:GHVU01216650.1.p1 GENE.GHVU01216650.1~~GHVU01216650.1.p1  ORF type:complete len:726 (+),score=95.58 GHVU01216650.1:506-2683(+)